MAIKSRTAIKADFNTGDTMTESAFVDVFDSFVHKTDDTVATGQLADGAVTGAKLETLSPSPAGTVGSGTQVPQITVDSKGRVTEATQVPISALVEYNAGTSNGSTLWVKASATGITISRTGATVTVSIPDGVKLYSFRLRNATNPGGAFTMTFNYANNSTTNQDYATMAPPTLQGIKGESGSVVYVTTNAATAGASAGMHVLVSAVSGGNISLQIVNYTGSNVFGSVAALILGNFA